MLSCVVCTQWSVCLLLLIIAPCLTFPLSELHNDATDLHNAIGDLDSDMNDLHSDTLRHHNMNTIRVNRPLRIKDIVESDPQDRSDILQSSLRQLYHAFIGQTGHQNDLPKITTRGKVRIPEVEAQNRKWLVEYQDDGGDVTDTTSVQKRYYRRRHCNFAQLTRKAFVELIKTGKLCGRRVATIRFALTGR